MSKAYFKEESRLGGIWIWLFIIAGVIPFVVGMGWLYYQKFYANLNTDQLPDNEISAILAILGAFMLIGLIALLMFGTTFYLEIREGAIHYKYWPFVWKWHLITPESIASWKVKKVSPLWYAGGWGYRKNLIRGRTAIITIGKEGLEISKKNGKQIFFSTAEKENLKKAMTALTKKGDQ